MLYSKKSIWFTQADILVIPVNTKGIMGNGLAAQSRSRFPRNFEIYQLACSVGSFQVGTILTTFTPHVSSLVYQRLLNFPTKKNWVNDSKLEYIEAGLKKVAMLLDKTQWTIAIPPLGCGKGKLKQTDVLELIVASLEDYGDRTILVGFDETEIERYKGWLLQEV